MEPVQKIWKASGASWNRSRNFGRHPELRGTDVENLERFPSFVEPIQKIWKASRVSWNRSRNFGRHPESHGTVAENLEGLPSFLEPIQKIWNASRFRGTRAENLERFPNSSKSLQCHAQSILSRAEAIQGDLKATQVGLDRSQDVWNASGVGHAGPRSPQTRRVERHGACAFPLRELSYPIWELRSRRARDSATFSSHPSSSAFSPWSSASRDGASGARR